MYEKVYCLVLNWNGKHFLEKCLDSVLAADYKNLHLVVVDNGSTDGSQSFVKKNYKNIYLLENKKNLGWAEGNNRGISYALKKNADFIFLLNNDTFINSKCISHLAFELSQNKMNGIVGPKILIMDERYKKTRKISFGGGKFTKNRYFGVHINNNKIDLKAIAKCANSEFITGAAMMIRRSVFEKIGLFDRSYMFYYEDADFCVRARNSNFKIRYVPSAFIYHLFSGSIKLNSPMQNYYTTRNHYLFVERNAPIAIKMRELLRTPKTIFEFYKSKDQIIKKYSLLGIRDYYLRRFGKRTYW